jgi:hypothetical protein
LRKARDFSEVSAVFQERFMRVMIEKDPYPVQLQVEGNWDWATRSAWSSHWIAPAVPARAPHVHAFRLQFSVEKNPTLRVHVSADERYELFLDGERLGRGSERGDLSHWFFETYELTLEPGAHILVSRVWSLGDQAPYAQMSLEPGFLLAAEGEFTKLLSTGKAPWEVKLLSGYEFMPDPLGWGTGANLILDAAIFPWGFEKGEGAGWAPALVRDPARGRDGARRFDHGPTRILHPATLPAMLDRPRQGGRVRHIAELDEGDPRGVPVLSKKSLPKEFAAWQAFLDGKAPLTLPPHTALRVIVDIEDYVCAYPELVTSDGKGASFRLYWAESLFVEPEAKTKGDRNQIEGKYFFGTGDIFKTAGPNRKFSTLWWQVGRYLEFVVRTADEPLTLKSFSFNETRYPLELESRFESSDTRLQNFTPIGLRGLQMCAHETYMDCPYYEQLMYVGDTRLECLVTYALNSDDRLPRKALGIFDASRLDIGLTQSRYPSRVAQRIPPFSLWWVAMVYDYALWRGDSAFVRSLMPGVRAVLEAFETFVDKQGLIRAPLGWNFMDWVPSWPGGVPPEGELGVSGLINWQAVYVLERAAQLEAWLGEKELEQRHRRLARELAKRLQDAFWVKKKGLFADDLGYTQFSEHTQCLALLSGHLAKSLKKPLVQGLLKQPGLAKATIYFSHYLFEAFCDSGQMDALFSRLSLWFEHEKLGLKTTLEAPEPSRSDCHAWGSHPLYHYQATLLGIRPGSMGFESVVIKPQLGPLDWAKGGMMHPQGWIEVDLKRKGKKLEGSITLPKGLRGYFIYQGKKKLLRQGKQKILQ